ncbi:MAG: cyclophilin-like fold protein [Actinomycetaceae bacterium]|nr:cyclophilin-like fold protein [Actinomycetaceae bacterium]
MRPSPTFAVKAAAYATLPLLVFFAVGCTSASSPDASASAGGGASQSAAAPPSSSASSSDSSPSSSRPAEAPTPPQEESMIVTINGRDFQLELADNSSVDALVELVGEGGLELSMEDYGGFEKVGQLPRSLPTNDEQMTTQAGDVILYQGNTLAIYYDTNSWSLTRIGRITDASAEELRQALGQGKATVTLRRG